MTILGVDLSHWQGAPNFAQVKASGRDFVVLKATEGTSYVDPTLAANRRNAHAAGLIVGLYHFARAGNPAAEALYFLRTLSTMQPGEFLVLDWEVAGADPPAWCRAWLDAAYAATGVRGFLYTYQQQLNAYNWSPVAQGNYAFWFAKYDQSTAQPTVPYWGAPAMKQFYDKGVVPGIAGPCDVDVFYGSREQLLAYGKGGTPPPPPPPPTVQEDDMRLVRSNDTGAVWLLSEFSMQAVPDQATYQMYQDAGVPAAGVPQSTLDALAVQTDARRKKLLDDMQGWILGSKPSAEDKPWLWDRIKQLQSGGVDAAAVATLVLAGIKAQMSADVTPPAAS